jgi:hypothetical protein
MAAALKVAQVVRGPRTAVAVGECESGLRPGRARQPAEHVIERTVLHRHDDDVLEPDCEADGSAEAVRRRVALDASGESKSAADAAPTRNCLRESCPPVPSSSLTPRF